MQVKNLSTLFNGIQTFLAEAGEASCYALQLLNVCIKKTGTVYPVIESLLLGIDSGYIYYNKNDPNDNNNFFVEYPDKFITLLTGLPCTVEHAPVDYKARQDQFIIERWERVTPKGTYSHFDSPDFHSLAFSYTVKYGKLVSLRVVTFH